ncbi:hypothetical protein [Streptomyces sp. NPDC002990]
MHISLYLVEHSQEYADTQALTALDAEYTLDADPAVTDYLRRTTRRTADALND